MNGSDRSLMTSKIGAWSVNESEDDQKRQIADDAEDGDANALMISGRKRRTLMMPKTSEGTLVTLQKRMARLK